jgi:hypothetical protein
MAEILSQFPATWRCGVFPRGAQVRLIEGTSKKPLSSMKTRCASSSAVFFYLGPHPISPPTDCTLVSLPRSRLWLLATPSQRLHHLPDIGKGIVNMKAPGDYLLHAFQCPQIRRVACFQRTSQQDVDEVSLLLLRQSTRASRSRLGPKSLQTIFAVLLVPPYDGAQRRENILGDRAITVASFEQANGAPSPLFEYFGLSIGSHDRKYTNFLG